MESNITATHSDPIPQSEASAVVNKEIHSDQSSSASDQTLWRPLRESLRCLLGVSETATCAIAMPCTVKPVQLLCCCFSVRVSRIFSHTRAWVGSPHIPWPWVGSAHIPGPWVGSLHIPGPWVGSLHIPGPWVGSHHIPRPWVGSLYISRPLSRISSHIRALTRISSHTHALSGSLYMSRPLSRISSHTRALSRICSHTQPSVGSLYIPGPWVGSPHISGPLPMPKKRTQAMGQHRSTCPHRVICLQEFSLG